MDEQWAGYDYYRTTLNGNQPSLVQGTTGSPVRPDCLTPEFRALAEPLEMPVVFSDKLRNVQYRDARFTKIPRAMRFNDRISMRSSRELREPFLDHRMFELAMSQSPDRKIENGTGKKMLRQIAQQFVPANLSEAPKRPMQTPQREWLRGSLRDWADEQIRTAISGDYRSFVDKKAVKTEWARYCKGESDNSFYVWQWIGLGLLSNKSELRKASALGTK
jgi:asparagine synthase (glutamine-hydrolysing)